MAKAVNIVMGGGGLKAVSYGGVLEEFERRGIKILGIAGVSAGTLIGLALALGYSVEEIRNLVHKTDFSKFAGRLAQAAIKNNQKSNPPRFLGGAVKFLKEHAAFELVRSQGGGIDDGSATREWLKSLFKEKHLSPKMTFKELKRELGRDFRVLAYDLNTNAPMVFSAETTPDDVIIEAVLASAALVPVFTPVRWLSPDGKIHFLADGGFVEVCPMDIFEPSPTVTLGLKPSETESAEQNYRHIDSVFDIFFILIGRGIESQRQKHIRQKHWHRVIHILANISTLDFVYYGNNSSKKDELWDAGKKAAADYLDDWEKAMFVQSSPRRALAESFVKIKLWFRQKFS